MTPISPTSTAIAPAKSEAATAATTEEIELDAEIVQLKKDIRKAELERMLRELRATLELEKGVNKGNHLVGLGVYFYVDLDTNA